MLCGAGIEAALARDGHVRCAVEEGATAELLRRLGDIVDETAVRQRSGATTYLAGRYAVPLHTDHPEADLVAWRCDAQDPRDGASVLADGHAILRAMGAGAHALRGVELRVPAQLPRQSLDRGAVWDGRRLYYAPWYPVLRASGDGRRALRTFESLLAMGFGHRRVRLAAGELLVVDNGRWLHGRDRLSKGSGRFLRRYWLRRRARRLT
ncbi:MAG: TauD/TfdA family dioxygenase [Chromatiales bacterium]|nr:TauD/TfdA family dioxygenase [Chromatiales bacterium]